jgi:hypothetical protein
LVFLLRECPIDGRKGKINYIEICCGPGRCVNRQGRSEFDGTALSVIKRPEFKHINKALFFDINETVVTILNQRLSALKAANAIASEHCEIITKNPF